MRTTYITATVIALLLGAWLYSGQVDAPERVTPASLADQNRESARVQADALPTKVRVTVIDASEQSRIVKVRGRTEAKRTVEVKAELPGKVVSRPVERGTVVAANDVLCELSLEDRRDSLVEASAQLSQAKIDYQGALKLQQKGFNSESAIAAAKARLAATQAELNRRELDLAKIYFRAPFDGVVEDVSLEIGDYVTPGATCAQIVDLDPMLLTGRVSEQEVVDLGLGQLAEGLLRNGTRVSGPVTFIGQTSDPSTRTYPIEIELPNPDQSLRSGITSEILVPVEVIMAQKVSPALIALDDAGGIGIRTINSDDIVEFHPIEIIADAQDGVWVTGLPNRAGLITVGQELVTAGERVDPVYQDEPVMPANAPEQNTPAYPSTVNDTEATAQQEEPKLQQAIAPDTSSASHAATTNQPLAQHAAL